MTTEIATVQTREEWLAERRKGLGGSDAAAVVGLSPYRTPLQVYLDKIGELVEEVSSPAIHWGNVLEPILRQEYSNQTGRVVYLPQGVLKHEKHPFMLATLDGYTDDGRVVELKTTRFPDDWGEPGTDEIPQHYLLQVQHYMAVTKFPVADVAVLIGGQDFRIYEVPADKEIQEMMIEAEAKFWEQVEKQIPPEPRSAEDILLRFRISNGKPIEASPEILDRVKLLKDLKAELKTTEEAVEQIVNEVKIYMGEFDTLTLGDMPLISWKNTKAGQEFNEKQFKEDHSDLYTEYLVEKAPSRRFLVK
jgi:putative phage-type endonuclease